MAKLPPGVNLMPNGKFRARVRKGDRLHSLGTFDTEEEAQSRVDAFREENRVRKYKRPSYELEPTHIRVAKLSNLEEHIDYYPDSGEFYWHNTNAKASVVEEGYVVILYGKYKHGMYYDAYEVAWTAMKGKPPTDGLRVKYLNGSSRDLRWENLEFYRNVPVGPHE